MTALFSCAALTIGVLSDFGVVRFPLNTLVLFGAYCIGLGWLTLKATFLPRAIGVLLIVAGLGWLTYRDASCVYAASTCWTEPRSWTLNPAPRACRRSNSAGLAAGG